MGQKTTRDLLQVCPKHFHDCRSWLLSSKTKLPKFKPLSVCSVINTLFLRENQFFELGMQLLSDFKSSKIKIINYKTITNTNRNYKYYTLSKKSRVQVP